MAFSRRPQRGDPQLSDKEFAPVALVFGIINLPCISLWVTFGTILRRWLHRPILVHAVNIGMALALVASLKPIVLELWAGL